MKYLSGGLKMFASYADSFAMTHTSHGFEATQLLNALHREQDEASMLRSLGNCMGVEFHPKSLPLPNGGVMEIGGYSAKGNAVCEVCATEGGLSEDEEETVIMNALKLNYVAQSLGNTVRQILLFRDRESASSFCTSDRVQSAMQDSTIEVCVLA
jgi:hypothetical protein